VGKTGFFFYIGDYQKDTRCLTAEARGCYVDWLCVLYEFGGTVTWPVSNFAQYAGVSEDTALHVLNQISITNVAEVEWQADSKGIAKHSKMPIAKLSNRRMVREARKQVEIRGKRIEAGRAGGSKRWQNFDSKHSTLPSPSLNPSSSLPLLKKEGASSMDSKPKDNPELYKQVKHWADQIYAIDKKRYARLIAWITAALQTYSVLVVAMTLERFLPYADRVGDGWWPYLDKILDKTEAQQNARDSEKESERFKRESREALGGDVHQRNRGR
jgi:uncharacterized protein YdaU (DUF1376 family)